VKKMAATKQTSRGRVVAGVGLEHDVLSKTWLTPGYGKRNVIYNEHERVNGKDQGTTKITEHVR